LNLPDAGDIEDTPDAGAIESLINLKKIRVNPNGKPVDFEETDVTMFFRQSLFSVSAVRSAHVSSNGCGLFVSTGGGEEICEHFDTHDEAMTALNTIKKAKGWVPE
jgi:hypothetical protein